MNRRLRISLLAVGGLLAGLVVTAFVATYTVLQPERFTAMLQSRAAAAGLELTLSSPASPTLFPKPALELQGLTLRGRGTTTPLIVASRGKLVLPWRTLLGGEASISRLELEGARIDLDAVSAYLATLPTRPSTAGAILPEIDAGFRITRGTLTRGARLLLSNVDIAAGSLGNDRNFDLALAAEVDSHPYSAQLRTRPQLTRGVLTLSDLSLELSSEGRFATDLHGTATWRGGADVAGTLAGRLTREQGAPFDINLNLTPANQRDPLFVGLKIDGADDHANLHVPPLAIADWWTSVNAGGALGLPPLVGTVDAAIVEVGNMRITGLHIQATPDHAAAAPAAPSSVGSRH